jgi:hypothetical protein
MTVKRLEIAESLNYLHRITVEYLGMGHMAAAASAGSANPRYLEHGYKRVR